MFFGLFLLFLMTDKDIAVQEKFTVNYVLLDVVAETKKGEVIKDLKPSDFVVTENRKKIEVTSFQIIDYDQGQLSELVDGEIKVTATAADNSETAEELHAQYIFALDLESCNVVEARRIFSELDEVMEKISLEKNVHMMIYSLKHGLISDFVDDPKTFRPILNAYRDRYFDSLPKTQVAARSFLTRNLKELEGKIDRCRTLAQGAPNAQMEIENCLNEEISVYIEIQEERVERAIGELEALAYGFQDRKGLKTMFFLSPGFSLSPGQAGIEMVSAYYPSSTSSLRSASNLEKEFRKVVHACVKNRVVFNTFDLFNWSAGNDRETTSELPRGNAKLKQLYSSYGDGLNYGLRKLSDESGGVFSTGTSYIKPMQRLINQSQYIYVLGYNSPPGKSGKYRKIKVKCKKKGVKLRYRQGYFGK